MARGRALWECISKLRYREDSVDCEYLQNAKGDGFGDHAHSALPRSSQHMKLSESLRHLGISRCTYHHRIFVYSTPPSMELSIGL